jgi:catechol 2,3-dioxygenase-like lactoylglutathione lyase family enzyme
VIDHVTLGVADLAASRAFYDVTLGALGLERSADAWGDVAIRQAGADRPRTTGLHVAIAARDVGEVERFHRAGVEAGYRDAGAPGERPQYGEGYVGAFLLDPDGNSVEAVVHPNRHERPGAIDHVWLRVADLAASRAFHAAIAPHAGFRAVEELPGRVRYGFGAGAGSFTLVRAGGEAGPVTTPVHLAFAARDHATIDAFHRAALAAGAPDEGGPGERSGSFAASVLDPDGHVVEAVDHSRR